MCLRNKKIEFDPKYLFLDFVIRAFQLTDLLSHYFLEGDSIYIGLRFFGTMLVMVFEIEIFDSARWLVLVGY